MNKILLNEGWLMQSSEKCSVFGEKIATTHFKPEGWYPVTVPGTVVSGLVENNVYPDPYYADNMKDIPGFKKHADYHYSNFHKPDDSPFRSSWWFRKSFQVEKKEKNECVWLEMKGINYRANIWLNGRRIAGDNYVNGTYRIYDMEITNMVEDGENVLAAEVFSPGPDELGITFIDWNRVPSDDSMGLWRPVSIYKTGPAVLKNPYIRTDLDTGSFKTASIHITAEAWNRFEEPFKGVLKGEIEGIVFEQAVELEAFEKKKITFTAEKYPQLKIENPRVWWPWQLGNPEMYQCTLGLTTAGRDCDKKEIPFGIRSIRSHLNEHGARQFVVNGKELLIRGTAWSPDLMMRQSEERDEIDLAYLKNLNMNTIRLEGKLATDYFWELCNRAGILVLAGWPCCNHFELWKQWKYGDSESAQDALRDQLLRLRNHPCFLAWFYGSDEPPPIPVEKAYIKVMQQYCDEVPRISSAKEVRSKVTGDTGVKMTGPYGYVPPNYWYNPKLEGFADKFNTETCPDGCIPIYESLVKFLPEDQQYVGSDAWNFHAGGPPFFSKTDVYDAALAKRYGKPADLKDYAMTSQVFGYEGWRAMYEANLRNFPKSTGVIGWMHNSGWPSLIWQVIDYYLQPNGAFYGSQKACEPLHIQYSYDDGSIWVGNQCLTAAENLSANIRICDMDGKETFSEKVENISLNGLEFKSVFSLPKIDGLSDVYFLILTLEKDSAPVSRNFYWLTPAHDTYEAEGIEDQWYLHPVRTAADMRPLRNLAKASVEMVPEIRESEEMFEFSVSLKNTSDVPAFFVWPRVTDGKSGELAAPVYWRENVLFLLPGEKQSIEGSCPVGIFKEKPEFLLFGWNV